MAFGTVIMSLFPIFTTLPLKTGRSFMYICRYTVLIKLSVVRPGTEEWSDHHDLLGLPVIHGPVSRVYPSEIVGHRLPREMQVVLVHLRPGRMTIKRVPGLGAHPEFPISGVAGVTEKVRPDPSFQAGCPGDLVEAMI